MSVMSLPSNVSQLTVGNNQIRVRIDKVTDADAGSAKVPSTAVKHQAIRRSFEMAESLVHDEMRDTNLNVDG